MGSGKSSVGIRLSYRLKMAVEDTDKRIEKRAGKTISDIFAEEGEESFRERERECLRELLAGKSRRIISTGGGLPTDFMELIVIGESYVLTVNSKLLLPSFAGHQ